MIVDFRTHYNALTDAELARWQGVGATTVLFTMHHPDAFTVSAMKRLCVSPDRIRRHDMQPGIYTGLLGLEKNSTIKQYDLHRFFQRTRTGAPVYYSPGKKRPWGQMFCPNSGYLQEYRLPLLLKGLANLDISTVFFDLPWFRTGGCFCPACRSAFLARLQSMGHGFMDFAEVEAMLQKRHAAVYAAFLQFKVRAIHDCIQQASETLKARHPQLNVLVNMGSCLSMIDNQYQGAWLCNLDRLKTDVMIEFNPYVTKTPLPVVGAAVRLAKTSLKGSGKVVFASTISDFPGNPNSAFYDTDKLEALYACIKKAGGIPYVSYAVSNPNTKKLRAPLEAYSYMYERVNRLQPDPRVPKVLVLYSPLSYHYATHKGLKRLYSNFPRTHQTQYLWPLWEVIRALDALEIPYVLANLKEAVLMHYSVVVAPRTVVIGDRRVFDLATYAEKAGILIATCESGRLNEQGEVRRHNIFTEIPGVYYYDDAPDWNTFLISSEIARALSSQL